MKTFTIKLIKLYSLYVSPLLVGTLGHACRYEPTCSNYAIESIDKYGTIRGAQMALGRIMSCNVFSKKSYYDPVK